MAGTYPRVYCVELNRLVDPQEARIEYFRRGDNKHFTFQCEHLKCRIPMGYENIYTNGVLHKKPCFKKAKSTSGQIIEHTTSCGYVQADEQILETDPELTKEANKSPNNAKEDHIITEFKMPKYGAKDSHNEPIRHPVDTNDYGKDYHSTKNKLQINRNIGTHATTMLSELVSDYRALDESGRKKIVNMDGYKLKWWQAFKRVDYYHEYENEAYKNSIVYWGIVDSVKAYGDDNFLITFVNKPIHDGKAYPVTLYIEKKKIEGYYARNLFKAEMNDLCSMHERNLKAVCYFIGTSPKFHLKEIKNIKKHVVEVILSDLRQIDLRVSSEDD